MIQIFRDSPIIMLKMYRIAYGLEFTKVFFAKLPAVLIRQSFLLPNCKPAALGLLEILQLIKFF